MHHLETKIGKEPTGHYIIYLRETRNLKAIEYKPSDKYLIFFFRASIVIIYNHNR